MRKSAKFVGLDVHQATTVAAVREASGRVSARCVLPTEEAALVEFMEGMRGRIHVTFEEGTQAQWLHDLVAPLVERVVVCDRRGESKRGNKGDGVDCEELSELLRRGGLRPVYHGSPGVGALKELTRTYENLVEDSTRAMLRLKALFRARGTIALIEHGVVGGVRGLGGQQLRSLPSEDSLPTAGCEGVDVEIEEQAYVKFREPQVRQHLRDMDRGELLYGLEFDDHQPLDEHVDPVPTFQIDVQVADSNRHLPLHLQPTLPERRLETDLVGVLQHSRPEISMDVDRPANDRAGYPVGIKFLKTGAPFVSFDPVRALRVTLFGRV